MKNKYIILVLICIIVIGSITLSGCLFNNGDDEMFEYGLMTDDTYYIKKIKSKDVTSITVPSTYKGKTVKEIGRSAFEGCDKLESITIPTDVVEIDVNAFSGCAKLESISLPNTIKVIKSGAFDGCKSLKYTVYENGNYLGNSENAYVALISGIDDEVTSFKVNANCNVIYSNALLYFTKVKTIDLPDKITYIGFNAFAGCSSLESFVVPNYVKEFQFSWFFWCSSLKSITLGANINSVLIDSMIGCTSFEAFEVYSTNSSYASKDGVLYTKDLKNLLSYPIAKKGDNFSIPSYVETVTMFAFDGCIYLKSLTMWSTVNTLSKSAVINCELLHTLYFNGTMSEWIALDNANLDWDKSFVVNKVICSDGTLNRSPA